VAQHEVAGGVSETGRGARALDQPRPHDPLEQRDLLADRGLRVAERPRGAAERALAGDGVERGQMADLDPEPTIRISHQLENYSELR
jgi:hypothetical protein